MKYKSSIVIALLIGLVIVMTGCQQSPSQQTMTKYMLDQDQLLSQTACQDLDFDADIVMIGSRYCPHCTSLDPVLAEIADTNNITYLKYDIVNDDEKQAVLDKGIGIRYTPVTIIGCRVIVGSAQEPRIQSIIDEQLN